MDGQRKTLVALLCPSGDRGAVIASSPAADRLPPTPEHDAPRADALPKPSHDRIATHDTEIET